VRLAVGGQTVEASLVAALGLHAAWDSKFGKIQGLRVWHYGGPLTPPRLRAIGDRIWTGLRIRAPPAAAVRRTVPPLAPAADGRRVACARHAVGHAEPLH
jgi:hypothetical protein